MSDTIAAQATPPGRGGVGILRVSGPLAPTIARAVLGRVPRPRHAEYLPFRAVDGGVIDLGIALYFPAPHSFTGEDVLELHGHGGPVVLNLLLRRLLDLGARLASPGEFSARAFLNDKLDLAQAEAIADLIDSASEQAARSALRSLQGAFSTRIHALVESLTQLRIYIEAALDFPEEEIDFLADARVKVDLERLQAELQEILRAAQQGARLREGMTVVIAGQPNVGKSSLLNQLAGHPAAIVTHIPGTTRDVLREQICIEGIPLHVIDTAGVRESADPVEAEGMRRAWEEISRADRVLLLVDDSAGITAADQAILARLPTGPGLTVVRNKIDLTGHDPAVLETDAVVTITLSAHTGAGLEQLKGHLAECAGLRNAAEGVYMARRRHLEALQRAQHGLAAASDQLRERRAVELMAEELRGAQQALGEITGEFTSDDLLGRIFASFCVGK